MISGIVLAGGQSVRFNQNNKAFLKIRDKSIIEHIIIGLKSVFNDVIVVTNNFDLFNYPVITVKDIFPGKGSLGGLYSGLVHSKTEYNFVVACDMPFLNLELIRYMKNNCLGFDVTVPKLKIRYETLHAIYTKNCIKYIEKQIEHDVLKINSFFKNVKIKEIPVQVIKKFDREFLSFFNVNTPYAYKKALKIAENLNLSSV